MKAKFLGNAAALTLTGFLLRGLGMLFRIYISGKIGEEGMGVYQLITSVYFLFITIAQSGLAVTVTRLCSKRFAVCKNAEAHRVLKSALAVAVGLGIASMTLMLTLSGVITKYWIADPRALYPLYALAFSLPFISVCNVFSGFFIAKKNVTFGCLSQIIEQLSRIAVAAAALFIFAEAELFVLLTAVVFANTVSEAVSCLFLALCFLLGKKTRETEKSFHIREIIQGAIPVALTRYLVSALHTAENMLTPSAIALFTGSREAALSQFGALKGMALPLLFFPFSFLSALSTLLVPEITEASSRSDKKRAATIVKRTCGITLTLSIMIGGVFFVFANPLGSVIYKSDNVGFIIKVLAPIVPFMYLDSICDGLLKGLGKQKQVFYNNCIDSAVRIFLVAILVPHFGINGFLFMMIVSNIGVSLLNFRLVLKASGVRCDIKSWFLLPFLWVGISAIITKFIIPFGASLPKILLGSLLFCAVFGCLLLVFGLKNKIYKNNAKTL